MKGACLCGRVTIDVARPPEFINICNCRFCRSLGAAWSYFDATEVTVTGPTAAYQREDLDDVWLTGHHCPACGSTTHYAPVPRHDDGRLGVNVRLFAQDDLDGIEVRYQDGRAVQTENDAFVVTGHGRIGDGKAF